jgi:hypothetical protein
MSQYPIDPTIRQDRSNAIACVRIASPLRLWVDAARSTRRGSWGRAAVRSVYIALVEALRAEGLAAPRTRRACEMSVGVRRRQERRKQSVGQWRVNEKQDMRS